MSTVTTRSVPPVDVESVDLTEKQRLILGHLRANADQTYFKSRLVGEALDLSAKEVGANITALDDVPGVSIEKWGYSGATTWKVSV
ncbi:MAG: hypothetical protein ABEJ57_01415 [Halobacteriaceae archaeon]